MEGLTEGRVVHFVMPDGQHRPAIVVRVWRVRTVTDNIETLMAPENGVCQLQVFTDGSNDAHQQPEGHPSWVLDEARSGIMWRTSVIYSENNEPGTWHWIERA